MITSSENYVALATAAYIEQVVKMIFTLHHLENVGSIIILA
tara:strand:+ start:533 stop:655 length:123 start_codon:yes stop_codon:yes gene_type:complete